MLNYLLFLPQLLLIALYDWIFFVNDYAAYAANAWWAFSFLHATFIVEIVSVVLLRRMKQMPLVKKHPIWLFTIIIVLQLLLAVVFSLVKVIELKWVIILSAFVFVSELLSLCILFLVQKRRDKKEGYGVDEVTVDEEPIQKPKKEPKEEPKEEPIEEPVEEPELPPPPKKIKSTAMLLLLKFLAEPNNWGVPADFHAIYELTESASACKQYTYEELAEIEYDLKEQTDALKTYLQNKSLERAKITVYNIKELLAEREEQIKNIEFGY